MKIKLTLPTAKMPQRANPTDAGSDLFATEDVKIPPNCHHFMDLGVQLEIPEGYVGLIFARSGLGSKYGIRPRNCTGVIDSKYRGNLGMMIENANDNTYTIIKGDKIAQLVLLPIITPEFEVVDELDTTNDRMGGFGHTGK